MEREGRITQTHIFSAGKNISETFKAAVNRYNIDRIVVFMERMENNKDRTEIDIAVGDLRRKTGELGIRFEVITVSGDSIDDVRDELFKLKEDFPREELFFNLTGGRKVLVLYLFTMALWLDGYPYYVDKSGKIIEFSIPRLHVEELKNNNNLTKILSIVYKNNGRHDVGVKNSDVYEELASEYKPADSTRKGGNYKLQRGTFSKWVRFLIDNKLLEEKYNEDNHKNKFLNITPDGIFAVKFFRKIEN